MRKVILPALAAALLTAPPLYAQEGFGGPDWAFEHSDLEAEEGYVFGRLDNGMRYIIRRNDRPEGTALVRMEIAAGRLDEREGERGLAHFVEHMAFNGSTNVPEGEMVRLLERLGLAFGADTNASTAFDFTQYKLDLPRSDTDLLDTALMLMRETASELLFDEDAVARERGVLVAERRDRTTYQRLNAADLVDFFFPRSLFAQRYPVLDREDVTTASAATLRRFWERTYIPANTTLVVVGDFEPKSVEAMIRDRFGDWQPALDVKQPDAGPVDPGYRGETDIYLHPALDTEITMARNGVWEDEPDTRAQRKTQLLRSLGYGMLARRYQKQALAEDPPFRSAGFGTGDVFDSARQTSLTVNAIEGRWREGMEAAITQYRQAMRYGFSEAELAEQVARLRTGYQNAVASADTRSNSGFANAAIGLARNERVPISPPDALALFEEVAARVTPARVLSAMRDHALPLDDALIRFQGRTAPEGGAEALRSTFEQAMEAPVSELDFQDVAEFAYTDFGEPGTIVSDEAGEQLGIRTIRFDNNVMLNLKPTDLEDDRIRVAVTLDGGDLLDTREEPLGTALASLLGSGGLGAHSIDELQTVLAGRTVGASISKDTDSFVLGATTTRRDLELQMQLIGAYLTDPGYRQEAVTRYRNGLDDWFARLDATPRSTLSNRLGGILSDNDPRFTLQDQADYAALEFADLRQAIGDRLARGAIEITLVGDFEEQRAIDLVAATLGALPEREATFRTPERVFARIFTADRGDRTLTHSGEADQALVTYIWPTTDSSDVAEVSTLRMLRAVVDLEVTETLRENLGKTYSPGVGNSESRYYPGYGTFALTATVEPGELATTRAAIEETVARLRSELVSADLMQRARQPIVEGLHNLLKTNNGWLAIMRRAQSEPDRIGRYLSARARYEAMSPAAIRDAARRYLAPERAVKIEVLPMDDGTD